MASMEDRMQDRFDAFDDAVRQVQHDIIEAARDLVMKPGGLVNRGVGVGLVVVERADKTDPHYRLCTAFEELDRLHHRTPPPPELTDGDLIARIIDPVSFEKVRQAGAEKPEDAAWRCDRARDKAAHIMAIISAPLSEGLRDHLLQRAEGLREAAKGGAENCYRYFSERQCEAALAEADEIDRLVAASLADLSAEVHDQQTAPRTALEGEPK